MDPIQGIDAVLSFYNNAWTPYVCTSDVTVTIDGDLVPIRTKGDGNWKKFDYQTVGFTISLGGVMVFNDTNFRSWDILQNQLSSIPLNFRLSFTDDVGNTKSMQGTLLVKTSAITAAVGQVVKDSLTFQGTGALAIFDGLIPCTTVINTITVNGQTGASGIVTVDYTYTGDLAQVMYQIDGTGSWVYAQAAVELSVPGLSLGAHTITIIPICSNGFQGTSLTQSFKVTQALSCNTTISGIVINLSNLTALATVAPGGTATTMNYSIDGGIAVNVPIGQTVSLKGLPVGPHTISMTPICLVVVNGVSQQLPGQTAFQNFTIASQPSQSVMTYNISREVPTIGFKCQFQIYVNGNAIVSTVANANGQLNVQVGSSVRCVVSCFVTSGTPGATPTTQLTVTDTTTSTVLSNQSQTNQANDLEFTFTASSDSYTIDLSSLL